MRRIEGAGMWMFGKRLVGVLLGLLLVASQLVAAAEVAQAKPGDPPPDRQRFDTASPAKVTPKRHKAKAMARFKPIAPVWPEAAQAQVSGLVPGGKPTQVGALPVRVSVPGKADKPATAATVRLLGPRLSEDLVGVGTVLTVTAPAGSQATIGLDYARLAGVSAGGLGGRFRWQQLPGCAVEAPTDPQCREPQPLDSVNDPATQSLTATVTMPAQPTVAGGTDAMLVLAASATTSSDQGTYTATSLKNSSMWQAGNSAGTFSWSYPLAAPAVAGSLAPKLSIDYSSGGTDGDVSSTNNQSSWVGEGFDLSMGFIERKYVSCNADTSRGTAPSTSVDLCWYSDPRNTTSSKWDNATLSLPGHSGPLVRAGTTSWRLKDDDGTRVEKLGSPAKSGSANSEYWKVTTPDGSQYFFGKGKADGATATDTNAKWLTHVAANQSGEPGYSSTFTSAFYLQAWRWNLDYVVDPTGDTMTIYYSKETNQYKKNGSSTKLSYDRGGTISKIFYGERQGSEASSPAAKVEFVVKERCDTSVSGTCETTAPTSSTLAAWPDVPVDAICDASYCPSAKSSPTFFTRKRLAQVNTFVRTTAGGYDPVDSWDLGGMFPATNDATSTPTWWLSSITRTGKAGSPVTLPPVRLTPAVMRNRIVGEPGNFYGLSRPRLFEVTDEYGGTTRVIYSGEDCSPTSLPANPATNTTRCFPVLYQSSPTAAPTTHWFTKYVVSSVVRRDNSVDTIGVPYEAGGLGLAEAETVSYTYSGGGAWRYDDTMLTPDKQRTWNQWRGYGSVVTVEGDSDAPQTVTEDTFFRGMNGDRADAAGTSLKTVKVTDSDGTQVVDDDPLAGQRRETRQLTAVGGNPDSRQVFDLWSQPTPGATDGRNQAVMVDVQQTRTTQYLTSGSRSRTSTVQARDSWGQPTQVEDTGDTAVTGDETCARTSYAVPSGTSTQVDLPAEESVMPALCTVAADPASALSWVKHFYDAASTVGGVTGAGLETRTDRLTGTPRAWATVATSSYDQHGRTLTVTDALNNTTSTSYTPTTLLPASSVTSKVDPDGTGPAPQQTTTVTLDPRLGQPVKTVTPAGQTSEATLDALGRVTAVWQPGRARTESASVTYTYVVNQNTTGLNAVQTRSLLPNGSDYRSQWSFLDALLRPRQTQTLAADGTTMRVQDSHYDSRGNTALVDTYLIANTQPSSTLVGIAIRSQIPRSTRTTHDYANRPLIAALYSGEVEKWHTTTSYAGDTVNLTPPAGGTPTSTVSDIHGRTTQLIQHLGTTITAPASTTSYTYNPAGQLATMTDPKGNTWSYTYDIDGNKLSGVDPDAGTTEMTYDLLGRLVTSKAATGAGVKTVYDGLGRVTTTTSLDGATMLTSNVYDTNKAGLLTSSSRWVNGAEIKTTINTYDAAGRPTNTSLTVPAIANLIPDGLAGTYTTTNSFNADGSPATTGLPATGPINAETLTYGYNPTTGTPTSLAGMAPIVTGTFYGAWDNISQLNLGAVATISRYTDIDPATGRLTSIRTWLAANGTSPAVTAETTNYRYDPAGNIIGAKAVLDNGQTDNQCFQYDYQQQLVEAFTAAPTTTCSNTTSPVMDTTGPSPYWNSWTTETIGKTSQRIDRSPAGTTTQTSTYPASGGGSVRPHSITQTVSTGAGAATRSYTYDAAGNTLTRPGPTGAQQTLVYNDENKLVQIDVGGTPVFDALYDPAGNRILKRENGTTTLTVAGTDLTINNTTGVKTASRYYTHQDQTVAVRTGNTNDQLNSIITDHQNTPHHQIRNNDSQLTTTWQDPYGTTRGTPPPPTNWAGMRNYIGGTNDTTGLIHLGARDYDPTLQHFTTTDPIQNLTDPLQHNPYLNSNNTPITKADPNGEYGRTCIDYCGSRADNYIAQDAAKKARHQLARQQLRADATRRAREKARWANYIRYLRDNDRRHRAATVTWKKVDAYMTSELNRNLETARSWGARPNDDAAAATAVYIRQLASWALMVKSGGQWDHKGKIDRLIQAGYVVPIRDKDRYLAIPGHDSYLYRDVWSNIHYGYVGKLTVGREVNDIGNRLLGGVDDVGDRLSISIGYELADKYPNGGLPNGAITEAIVSHLDDYRSTNKLIG